MQTVAAIYAYLTAHGPTLAVFTVVVLSSLITGLSKYPQEADVVSVLKTALSLFSLATHSDSPGTFKLPLTIPQAPPTGRTVDLDSPGGFIRLQLLLGLALAALMLAALPAFAQTAAPPDAVPQRLVGGCNAKGTICFGPSVAISMTAYDLTHKHVIGSFAPGLGYGVTFNQGRWDSFGFDAYLSMQTGPQEGVTFAGMVKFANGYIRIGLARQILSGGPASTFIPAGLGLDF